MLDRKSASPNLEESQQFLNDLLEEVSSKESHLSGGEAQALQKGTTAVRRLKETIVAFGDPRSRLIPLTADGFQAKGIELSDEVRQLMKQFDFYSMVVSVEPRPQPSVLISGLECELTFLPRGNQAPIAHRILPNHQWRSLLKTGVALNLGLDANLEVSVGLDAEEFARVANLPESQQVGAKIRTKDQLKALTIFEGLNYQFGNFEIFAQGEDTSQCYWRIETSELQKQSTVKFSVIFKVPKGWDAIALKGKVWLEPEINWLTGELSHVIKALPAHLRDVFGSLGKATQSFAVGQQEEWTGANSIKLPRTE